jgi:hypothetical protein
MVDVFFDLLGGAFEEVGIDGECDESEYAERYDIEY